MKIYIFFNLVGVLLLTVFLFSCFVDDADDDNYDGGDSYDGDGDIDVITVLPILSQVFLRRNTEELVKAAHT